MISLGRARRLRHANTTSPSPAPTALTLHDILVGEVWLCSGQSNMEDGRRRLNRRRAARVRPRSRARRGNQDGPPILRSAFSAWRKSHQPPDLLSDGWTECRGDALARFSAAGFFSSVASYIRRSAWPVGLIESNWGGSRIEEWIFRRRLRTLGRNPRRRRGTDLRARREARQSRLRRHDPAARAFRPSVALLWYQGESQIIAFNDGLRYADKMNVLVTSWRALWARQTCRSIACNWRRSTTRSARTRSPTQTTNSRSSGKPSSAQPPSHTPASSRSRTRSTTSPTSTPVKKSIVGHRLAALALADTYGRKSVTATFPTSTTSRSRAPPPLCIFRSADGLATRDGQPTDRFRNRRRRRPVRPRHHGHP